MAKVELYASRFRLRYVRIQLAVVRQEGIAIRQAVSHDVAWTHFLEKEFR
jgi:hypothetical protein